MGTHSGFELSLAGRSPDDESTEPGEALTVQALEQEWQANREARRRRDLFRLVHGTREQPPSSVA